jgi:hypothetical protein
MDQTPYLKRRFDTFACRYRYPAWLEPASGTVWPVIVAVYHRHSYEPEFAPWLTEEAKQRIRNEVFLSEATFRAHNRSNEPNEKGDDQ